MTSLNTATTLPKRQPLSNLQLTLLNLYSSDVSEEDLKSIQRLIARFFAEKATELADKDYVEKGYTADIFLNKHIRSVQKINSK
jgi:hypothetical protein